MGILNNVRETISNLAAIINKERDSEEFMTLKEAFHKATNSESAQELFEKCVTAVKNFTSSVIERKYDEAKVLASAELVDMSDDKFNDLITNERLAKGFPSVYEYIQTEEFQNEQAKYELLKQTGTAEEIEAQRKLVREPLAEKFSECIDEEKADFHNMIHKEKEAEAHIEFVDDKMIVTQTSGKRFVIESSDTELDPQSGDIELDPQSVDMPIDFD